MASRMPSGAQLPSVWNKEMDRFICKCEALGDVDTNTMVRALKKKFPELERHVITPESLERRILMLEQGDNDYFKEGMETAVARAEAAGFILPPMDFEKYARKPEEVEATEPATIAGGAGSDSKSSMAGNEDDPTGGEGSTQLPSGGVLGTGKANEKQKSVEEAPAPTTSSSGRKPDLKASIKARLGMGKENKSGASSSRGDDQELQSRGAPSSRPSGN